ncbi:UNVERIFIED_CONTAM: putative pentatricopeptide repeat-containing protein, partial [Sesamum radiatum]
SALLDMYSKCRDIKNAETVFRKTRHKNIVSWTAMLVGYGQNGYSEEAVRVFCEMQRNGVEPDYFTLGLISFITVSNALVTLYGKCGNIEESHRLFNEIKLKDEVSWTALVSCYAQFGKANETINLFEEMLAYGLQPDGVTFVGVLSACSRAGRAGELEEAKNFILKMPALLIQLVGHIAELM